ncbi:chemotaxis protein MotB [Malonomonas rubra DSM 5091]|uniref:Chemotaxis protein MotB n=1 Tax=Malonomonas rubra DSM 5091 TaxID=1122189 RepID=A0A1M6NLK5_MALRU|nr:OmpA family protein [Malonomonas rubra]SHJ96484.1 chemotaxis protein MotB [Malonomonas rubra DSM 5091]
MKRFFPVMLICLSLLLGACVSKNTFEQKVNEADQLSQDVAQLENDVATLQQEKKQQQDDMSKLNARLVEVLQQNSKLQRSLLAASAEQERKEGDISRHQQRINMLQDQLNDMQQTNDNLLATIEELQQQVEKERIAKEARLAKVKNTYDQLVGALEEEIERGELTISNLEGKLSVNMLNKILFDSGKAEVKPEGKKVLSSLGGVLNQFPDKALRIEGHTDNVQISSRLIEKFPSNWELSTARATNIVHYLQDQGGVPGERLATCGYSEYQPVADNETPEGRAENRRTEIVLVPFESGVGFKVEE